MTAWARVADRTLRIAGGLVALSGGLLVGVLSLVWVPWRLGTLRLPLATVVAVVGIVALLWFAPRATGTRWGVLLPAAGWLSVVVAASLPTSDGSQLVVPGDWVAILTIFTGTIVLVVGSVLAIAGPGPPPLLAEPVRLDPGPRTPPQRPDQDPDQDPEQEPEQAPDQDRSHRRGQGRAHRPTRGNQS